MNSKTTIDMKTQHYILHTLGLLFCILVDIFSLSIILSTEITLAQEIYLVNWICVVAYTSIGLICVYRLFKIPDFKKIAIEHERNLHSYNHKQNDMVKDIQYISTVIKKGWENTDQRLSIINLINNFKTKWKPFKMYKHQDVKDQLATLIELTSE